MLSRSTKGRTPRVTLMCDPEQNGNVVTINVPLILKMQEIIFLQANYFMCHFKGYFAGDKTFLALNCPESSMIWSRLHTYFYIYQDQPESHEHRWAQRSPLLSS